MNLSQIDWDDLRFFLAVARTGTVTGAARRLSVNHSTVTRRITAFEKKVGVRLFERLSTGYVTTPAGEDVLNHAERMETEFNAMERHIAGRDDKLGGPLCVTAPATLINNLFMPHIARFIEIYPDIELQLMASYENINLNRREADIAIRITNNPSENLVGRRLSHIT
ncbi:MAG: LysR family transcriptional regulator, partial [Pseudomonadota bacterium]